LQEFKGEVRKKDRKKSYYYFMKENCSMSRNIFRSLKGLLRSWKSAVRKSAMQQNRLNCRRYTDSKLLVDASFIFGKALTITAMLRDTIRRPLHIFKRCFWVTRNLL
jgi:hypothetical protein